MARAALVGGAGGGIEVVGLESTLRAIRALDPDVNRELNREVRAALKPVRDLAAANSPHRTGDMASRYVIRKSRRGWRIEQDTPQGVILELAGSRSSGHDPQGISLIRNLTAQYGPPGRFLWEAWDELEVQTEARVRGAIRTAERALERRLENVGGRS
jgi:hypothetical protein